MGWETRKRGGRYYTRSRRVGGRVVREYVGGGVIGELAADVDALERAERTAHDEEFRQQQSENRELDEMIDGFSSGIDVIVATTLESAGYHRHKRGEWRRRRKGAGHETE